ncbi:hypothetical protein [Moorella stamsii]|uniref:hypothetical protein n=1 Tax=Neomoorella stamsii TaxID=1266720 RepID=UPI0006D5976E|nr:MULTISPECIES: hypothetical protein [Moorella]
MISNLEITPGRDVAGGHVKRLKRRRTERQTGRKAGKKTGRRTLEEISALKKQLNKKALPLSRLPGRGGAKLSVYSF